MLGKLLESIGGSVLESAEGSLNQLVKVNIETGVVTSVVNNLKAPHGLVFVPKGNGENEGDHGEDH
jgi:hypothetical protein